mmetsp:Transcript_22581/g.34515  ORF Transcript_22581/g.34515 Transcript_22581/m.34515 type:complete len:92 (-) Transcript_22581:134-409(-)
MGIWAAAAGRGRRRSCIRMSGLRYTDSADARKCKKRVDKPSCENKEYTDKRFVRSFVLVCATHCRAQVFFCFPMSQNMELLLKYQLRTWEE